jgi:LPS export ABC transporter protein LptC
MNRSGLLGTVSEGFVRWATVVVGMLVLAGCEERVKPTVSDALINQDLPTQESWNATITFTDSGRVTGILRAGYIASYAQRNITLLDSSIIVDFFDQQQRHTSTLTAERGKVFDLTHDFEATGNVVVVSDSGTTLKTEQLFWTNTTQRVHTEAFVEITSPTEHIRGHGLESDQRLEHYRIFKVTGRVVTEK